MERQWVGPYLVSNIAAVIFLLAAWRWRGVARYILGVGFVVAGLFNSWAALHSPQIYVQGFGPHSLSLYRAFIYGTFSRHVRLFVLAIACGQVLVGVLAFAPRPWRTLSSSGAIIFLLAITPLGIGSAAPAPLIFAIGVVLLFRENGKGESHFQPGDRSVQRCIPNKY